MRAYLLQKELGSLCPVAVSGVFVSSAADLHDVECENGGRLRFCFVAAQFFTASLSTCGKWRSELYRIN